MAGTNGILAIPASATKKSTMVAAPSKPQGRAGLPKLRLIIRRLPPGLTEVEFQTALGEEWKVGGGKVDWAAYKEGKISRDPSKPSRPARAYLKVKEQSYLDLLSSQIKQTNFQDAKNTSKDACLLGPPSLEFAPYGKIPGNRVRHDGRAGTIDQDPEFIDFLQSLTEPATKPATGGDEDARHGKVTTTPLVQFIKDKKANKAKEAIAAKTAKVTGKPDVKETKSEKPGAKVSVIKATPAAEKARREKATQDAVKAINKTVTAMSGKGAPSKGDSPTPAKVTTAPQSPVKRERERGNASIAARILQRDLGLAPKERRTIGTNKSVTSSSEISKDSAKPVPKVNLPGSAESDSTSQPANTTQSQSSTSAPAATTPTGPRNARHAAPTTQAAKPGPAPTQRPPKSNPQPSPGAKSAFLKHANPSQGVTEALLQSAFSEFGTLLRCEIDKKKGFGYVDFADTEGLKKAMQASPVKIGNGHVVVLENKSKPGVKTPMVVQQNKTQQSQVATQSGQTQAKSPEPTTAIGSPTSTPVVTATTTPPVAPRGGVAANRGGRGGHMGPGRGNFGPPGRGGRGGFRGRGGFFPNQSRGGSTAVSNSTATSQASTAGASPAPAAAPSATGTTETK